MPAEADLAGRRRCGVLGSPVGSSLSPALHRAAYAALGLDWTYDAHEVDEAGLAAFLRGLDHEWRGLSVTMPLKQAVIVHCAEASDLALRVHAVNTVVVAPDRRLLGSNTDVPGFIAAWREVGISAVGTAVVVGTGATARSAVAALAEVGATRVTVLARRSEPGGPLDSLLSDLGLASQLVLLSEAARLGSVDLVVSTIPARAQEDAGWVGTLVERTGAISDVVYGPIASPLIAAGRRAGLPCADGFALLLHQAALQVEEMTGRPAPVDQMRAAGRAALAR